MWIQYLPSKLGYLVWSSKHNDLLKSASYGACLWFPSVEGTGGLQGHNFSGHTWKLAIPQWCRDHQLPWLMEKDNWSGHIWHQWLLEKNITITHGASKLTFKHLFIKVLHTFYDCYVPLMLSNVGSTCWDKLAGNNCYEGGGRQPTSFKSSVLVHLNSDTLGEICDRTLSIPTLSGNNCSSKSVIMYQNIQWVGV